MKRNSGGHQIVDNLIRIILLKKEMNLETLDIFSTRTWCYHDICLKVIIVEIYRWLYPNDYASVYGYQIGQSIVTMHQLFNIMIIRKWMLWTLERWGLRYTLTLTVTWCRHLEGFKCVINALPLIELMPYFTKWNHYLG